MSITVKINVALREQICKKIGSERVKGFALYTKIIILPSPFSFAGYLTLDVEVGGTIVCIGEIS